MNQLVLESFRTNKGHKNRFYFHRKYKMPYKIFLFSSNSIAAIIKQSGFCYELALHHRLLIIYYVLRKPAKQCFFHHCKNRGA